MTRPATLGGYIAAAITTALAVVLWADILAPGSPLLAPVASTLTSGAQRR